MKQNVHKITQICLRFFIKVNKIVRILHVACTSCALSVKSVDLENKQDDPIYLPTILNFS